MRISGKQVRKVVLLKKTTTENEYNEPIETWNPDTSKYSAGEFFVEWWDQGGKETLENGQIVAVKDTRCKCRYIADLNEKDYAIRKDKDYDIQSIKEIGRSEGQLLILEARDNQ